MAKEESKDDQVASSTQNSGKTDQNQIEDLGLDTASKQQEPYAERVSS